ncbi:MAG TPA: ribosome maturation factor RimM [Deltaproteobacteria bacterium]|nr:ribosome maturation factor RimM [Deltaproteobacteria bacterium]
MASLVEIARINGPHGLKGKMRVSALSGNPANLSHYRRFIVGPHGSCVRVRSLEISNRRAILALEGIDHISQVEMITGQILYVPREDLPALSEDEYYWRDLVGLDVVDVRGRRLGVVAGLFPTGSNDVLEVDGHTRHLIPFTSGVILEVSVGSGRIVVDTTLLEDVLDPA